MQRKMKVIKYIATVLPDGHLSLPEEIKKKKGLTANSKVKVVQQPRSKVFLYKALQIQRI